MMRASTKINSGEFTSARFTDTPNAKPAKPKTASLKSVFGLQV